MMLSAKSANYMKKILVITHDTFLSGAPILLLHLMKLLKEKGYRFNTIIRIKSSPLANEFRALSDKCGFYQRSKPKTFSNKLKRKLFCKKNEFDITPFLYEVDCIFSNTITNGEILALARKHFKGPVFSYIHELKMASSFFSTDSLIFDTMKMSDHFFVPSDAVKNYLLHSYEVP